MFTAEEKQQLDQLRWKYDIKLETHIKPVEGGYLIQAVERFVDPAGIVVATASQQSIATNGLSVANMIYDMYGAEYDKDPPLPKTEPQDAHDFHGVKDDHYEVPLNGAHRNEDRIG